MQYRRLTREELEPLAEDFALFLATNSIDKKMWDEIKSNDAEKAENLLDIFSDMVFEKALKSAKFLERISETEMHCFAFFEKQAHLISVRFVQKNNANFFEKNTLQHIPKLLQNGTLEMVQGTKTFAKSREQEMFAVMQTGAVLCKGELYQNLLALI